MHDHGQEPKARADARGPVRDGRTAGSQTAAQAARAVRTGEALTPQSVLAPQGGIGNAAISRLLELQRHTDNGGCCDGPEPEDRRSGDAPIQRSTVHDVLRSPGKPLPEALRSEMEARIGANFRDVVIHDNAAAARSAVEVNADAYTANKNHIVVGPRGLNKRTLAHELTHVEQQRAGAVAGTDNGNGLRVSDPSDRFERAAEANARRVMSGPVPVAESAHSDDRPSTTSGRVAPSVQRSLFIIDEMDGSEHKKKRIDKAADAAYLLGFEESTSSSAATSSALSTDDWTSSSASSSSSSSPSKSVEPLVENLLSEDAQLRIVREIAQRYMNSSRDTVLTLEEFSEDVTKRLTLIAFMGYANKEESPFRYSGGNKWTMPADRWKGIAASDPDDKNSKPIHGVAYESIGSPYDATMELFRHTKEQGTLFADCSSLIISLHYRALAEVLGKRDFDHQNPDGVVIHPIGYALSTQADKDNWVNNEPIAYASNGLVYDVSLENFSRDELIPGDWVYFENFSDYEKTHSETAAWAGEHSLYMGGGMYQGFGSGEEPCTYEEMTDILAAHDSRDRSSASSSSSSSSSTARKREKSDRSITGELPGITAVRRLRKPGVKEQAKSDEYDKKENGTGKKETAKSNKRAKKGNKRR